MGYCTIEDIRAEGITEEQANDDRLTQLIAEASDYIDTVTRMWYEPRDLVLKVDGSDSRRLYLMYPIITLTEVKIDDVVIALADLVVYNRIVPDDRSNPKIERKKPTSGSSIFVGSVAASSKFALGQQNVELTGSFGYTADGTNTPELIKRACILLVIRNIPQLGDKDELAQSKISTTPGALKSEKTDGHEYEFDNSSVQASSAVSSASALGLTGDPEIDDILVKYMALRPKYAGVS